MWIHTFFFFSSKEPINTDKKQAFVMHIKPNKIQCMYFNIEMLTV